MEGDSKALAERDKAALGGPGAGPGYMSVDEVRQSRNLPPRGGKFAEPYYPEAKASAKTAEEKPTEETE